MGKRFVLIGRCYKKKTGGPNNIVRGLNSEMKKMNIEYIPLLAKEDSSKIRYFFSVIRECLCSRNAIINVHTYDFTVPLIVLVCSYMSKRNHYYMTIHGIFSIEAEIKGDSSKKYRFLERLLVKRFQNVICVSELQRKELGRLYGRENNMFVIPNATDARSNVVPKRNKFIRIVSLGGLQLVKGIDYILQLAVALKRRGIDFKIELYGGDPENRTDWFNTQCNKNSLSDLVLDMGEKTNKQEIFDIVSGADFQLCLSRFDTYNVGIAESLVLGCPVITTEMCGASYLIHDDAGIVVNIEKENENGYDDIIAYIMSFVSNPEKRSKIYNNREKYIQKLSWNKITLEYLSLTRASE